MAEALNKLYLTKNRLTLHKKYVKSIPKDFLQMAIKVQSPIFNGKVPHQYHFFYFWKVGHSIQQPNIKVDGTDKVAKRKSKKEKDKDSKLEKALKAWNNLIWNIKDELKKAYSMKGLKELLIFSKRQVSHRELVILDQVAHSIAFGAFLSCEEC
ncbi:Poly [ADP-ribose] polymerase 1 [Fukomys damarensis]|uniref:Poly [ADP-ribose] polymerase 1 n=1 Tax=Fukomys damarensis TaxID=885580 RepID=A0A091CJV2_FUKDA|nr:Poly [ADP-ribose] polymerase 1 [Fukomys damarensis]